MRSLVFLCCLPAFVFAESNEATQLAGRVEKYYAGIQDLHAKFEQLVDSGTGGHKRASGQLWLKRPGRMRWDYVKPEKKLMVTDGKLLWIYEPEDQQAFRQELNAATLPSSVSVLLGQGKLGDEFTVTTDAVPGLGTAGDAVLKLVPKKPTAQYRYLHFVVDRKTAQVKETLVYETQGGINHLTFRETTTNRGVPDGKFSFTPPPGTKILRP